jgi:osmoprotectant transport system permease protein
MKASAHRFAALLLLSGLLSFFLPPAARGSADRPVRIGSKTFTESVILGEIITHMARSEGERAEHRRELGGTRVLWSALRKGEIDVYPEYTGTIGREIFAGRGIESEEDMRRALAEYGVRMTGPLGFNNTYVIGMRPDISERLGVLRISDLREHPELRFGFGNEFMDRADGWPTGTCAAWTTTSPTGGSKAAISTPWTFMPPMRR